MAPMTDTRDGRDIVERLRHAIGQLAILNLPVGTDYREGSQALALQIVSAIRGQP